MADAPETKRRADAAPGSYPNTTSDATATREGVPVRVGRQKEQVEAPEVVWVADRIERERLSTNGMIARGDTAYHLTRDGKAAAALLATSERGVPPWF